MMMARRKTGAFSSTPESHQWYRHMTVIAPSSESHGMVILNLQQRSSDKRLVIKSLDQIVISHRGL